MSIYMFIKLTHLYEHDSGLSYDVEAWTLYHRTHTWTADLQYALEDAVSATPHPESFYHKIYTLHYSDRRCLMNCRRRQQPRPPPLQTQCPLALLHRAVRSNRLAAPTVVQSAVAAVYHAESASKAYSRETWASPANAIICAASICFDVETWHRSTCIGTLGRLDRAAAQSRAGPSLPATKQKSINFFFFFHFFFYEFVFKYFIRVLLCASYCILYCIYIYIFHVHTINLHSYFAFDK